MPTLSQLSYTPTLDGIIVLDWGRGVKEPQAALLRDCDIVTL